MTIPIEREPEDLTPERLYERCCFCRVQTPFWTALASREGGAQVACCPDCSDTHEEKAVPSKTDWCKKEIKLSPSFTRGPF